MNVFLSSADWAKIAEVMVYDPDGWDRANFDESWHEPISFEEFVNRLVSSTTAPYDVDKIKRLASTNLQIKLYQEGLQ